MLERLNAISYARIFFSAKKKRKKEKRKKKKQKTRQNIQKETKESWEFCSKTGLPIN